MGWSLTIFNTEVINIVSRNFPFKIGFLDDLNIVSDVTIFSTEVINIATINSVYYKYMVYDVKISLGINNIVVTFNTEVINVKNFCSIISK